MWAMSFHFDLTNLDSPTFYSHSILIDLFAQ